MAKKKAANKKSETKIFSKYVRWFCTLFGLGFLSVIFLFLFASWGLLGEMPDHTLLENPRTNLA